MTGRAWHQVSPDLTVECLPGCGYCGLNPVIYDASIKDLASLPTAAERKDARVATLLEGHAAGLHTMPAGDCPLCSPVETPKRDRLRRRAARGLDRWMDTAWSNRVDGEAAAMYAASERFIESVGDYVLSRLHSSGLVPDGYTASYDASPLHHNSHYGVAPRATMGSLHGWIHQCGNVDWWPIGQAPADGGCDGCESGSDDASDWRPLYVDDREES